VWFEWKTQEAGHASMKSQPHNVSGASVRADSLPSRTSRACVKQNAAKQSVEKIVPTTSGRALMPVSRASRPTASG
jgi:hypothetical protein